MKNTHLLLFALGILLTLSACKKDGLTYTISGTITDGSFNKALAGAEVQLLASKIESGVYNSTYSEMQTATTDANGNFSMEIKDELVAGYRFYIHKDDYFDQYIDVDTDKLEEQSTFTQNSKLYAQSSITLKIKNTMPLGPDDKIKWRYSNIDAVCRDCCNNLLQEGIGATFQTDATCLVRGEKWIKFSWSITKTNQATINASDSIFCPAFGSATYEINY